jgi:hypothetical protein
MYQTWQNKASIAEYGVMFYDAIQCCDLVGFEYTPDVLLTAYMRGLSKAFREVLTRHNDEFHTYDQCEDFLLRAEIRGAANIFNGSQPRNDGDNNNSNRTSRSHSGGHYHRSNNNSNNNDSMTNSSNTNNNNAGNNNNASRNASSGRNASGAAGGGRGNGSSWRRDGERKRERDHSELDCRRCGVRGHIARDCNADISTVEAFRNSQRV